MTTWTGPRLKATTTAWASLAQNHTRRKKVMYVRVIPSNKQAMTHSRSMHPMISGMAGALPVSEPLSRCGPRHHGNLITINLTAYAQRPQSAVMNLSSGHIITFQLEFILMVECVRGQVHERSKSPIRSSFTGNEPSPSGPRKPTPRQALPRKNWPLSPFGNWSTRLLAENGG